MENLGTGIPFADAVELAKKTGDATLAAMLGPAQLIGAPPEDDASDEWSFHTRAMTGVEASMRLGIDLWRAYVFPVKKQRSTFADVIIVGRASTSDVFIDHASISKLHARIRHAKDDAWTIADAGSTNGTAIGSRAVSGEEPLAYGTRVRIGNWTLRFEKLGDTLAILRGT